jgi:Cd2+/Zn2+-exporting ATPase
MSESHDDPGAGGEDRATAEGSFTVPDMDCPGCAGKVESSLGDLQGVATIDARPASGTVAVTFDDSQTSVADLTDAIEAAGYEVTEGPADGDGGGPAERGSVWTSGEAIKIWIGALFLAGGLLLKFALPGSNAAVASALETEFLLADVLFLGAVAVAGQEILRGGYFSARNLNLDIDFLMSAAIVSAIIASLLAPEESLYVEAATLAVLFSFAELLEGYAMDRARNSLRELMDLSPDEATVRRDGEEVTLPVEDVVIGDVVLVRPGEKIPMDGQIVDGESAVDEAPITGESVPVSKIEGDEVYAGTINEDGYLEVQVTAEASENTLSRIVELVEDAQSNQTDREQFVERFAGYYTPVMVTFALLVAAVPPLVFDMPWLPWFVNGITMLVLACPCAFVISTPVSVVSGITSAARNGVLIKGGNHLEAMGAVDVVAMDKTGTLTKGELSVTDVVPLNGNGVEDVLMCARGVEKRSQHPIGKAIVDHAEEATDVGEVSREVAEFESLTGKGVQAALDGTQHYAGNPALFDELGFDLEHVHVVGDEDELVGQVRDICSRQGCLNLVEDTIPELQDAGKTVILVGTEDEIEGIIAVADEVRPEAEATVTRLHDLGVETVMLTGDNEGTARAIADQVGIQHYRAGLLPEEKIDEIEALKDEYDGVAMVGDGINDAPALASATVGIAMGAAGTDTALETADVALMEDDLAKLPYLAELSADANSVIRQNVWASLAIKLLLAVGVPLGFVNVAAAVLIGDAGMTVGVTGNAMRLSNVKPD